MSRDPTSTFRGRLILVLVVVSALLTALVLAVLGPTVVSEGPITIAVIPALVVLSWLVAGLYGVVGCVMGYLVYLLLHGGFAPSMVGGVLAFGLVISVLLAEANPIANATPDARGVVRSVSRFVATIGLASITAGAVTAWGFEVFGQFRFFPMSVFLTIEWFVSAVLFGGAGSLLLARSMTARQFRSRLSPVRETLLLSGRTQDGWPVTFVLVSLGWFVAGNVLSVGFQLLGRIPSVALRSRGLGTVLLLDNPWLFGPGGTKLQVALGVVSLVLISATLWRWQTNPGSVVSP